jgi:hypothetical protein
LPLPASVGGHPALGFEPLRDTDLPILPASVRLRQITVSGQREDTEQWLHRTVPVGTPETFRARLRGESRVPLEFVLRDGTAVTFLVIVPGGRTDPPYPSQRRGGGGSAGRIG